MEKRKEFMHFDCQIVTLSAYVIKSVDTRVGVSN